MSTGLLHPGNGRPFRSFTVPQNESWLGGTARCLLPPKDARDHRGSPHPIHRMSFTRIVTRRNPSLARNPELSAAALRFDLYSNPLEVN